MRHSESFPFWSAMGLVFCGLLLASAPVMSSLSENMQTSLEALVGDADADDRLPAGSGGWVVARGDKLFFEEGAPARFWGTGLTFSAGAPIAFPPPKDQAEAFVKRIKAYGFNLVRFVGIDNSLSPLCAFWREHGYFGGPVMDRLDYLVAMFVRHGIYYSFSINNSGLCPLDALPNSRSNTHPKPWRRYHGVRLLYPEMVRQQAEWIGAFFSHENTYTGKTYAADPANVYLAAVNEDSIWDVYLRGGKYLSAADKRWLENDFVQWLNGSTTDSGGRSDGPGGDASRSALGDVAAVSLWKPQRLLDASERAAIFSYLSHVDARLVTAVRNRLRALGYQGLITPTNNWYGYGALHTVARYGDFVEMHGYFDHPVSWRGSDSSFKGLSFLMPGGRGDFFADLAKKDWSFPLPKASRSALTGMPMVIGEWNHAAWSPHAYEGPILLYAYSALQGYAAIVAHTWFPYPSSRNGPDVPPDAFAVSMSPILLRLNPVLSRAWRDGCLGPNVDDLTVPLGATVDDYLQRVFAVGLGSDPDVRVEDGFGKRIRVQLPGALDRPTPHAPPQNPDEGSEANAVAGRLLTHMSSESGWVKLEGRCVAGAVFSGSGGTADFDGGVRMEIEQQGGIVALALDGASIARSKDLFLALVGSPAFLRPGMERERLRFRLPPGVSMTAGSISALFTIPSSNGCPSVRWVGHRGTRDRISVQPVPDGHCTLHIESSNGAWLRIRGGEVTVATE